jgi:hypothetical protein
LPKFDSCSENRETYRVSQNQLQDIDNMCHAVIVIINKTGGRTFSKLDINILENMAPTVVAAVKISNLYLLAEKRINKMKVATERLAYLCRARLSELTVFNDVENKHSSEIDKLFDCLNHVPRIPFRKERSLLITDDSNKYIKMCLLLRMHQDLFPDFCIPKENLKRFLIALVKNLSAGHSTYHIFDHAFYKMRTVYVMFKEFGRYFTPIERFSFYLATSCCYVGLISISPCPHVGRSFRLKRLSTIIKTLRPYSRYHGSVVPSG